MKKVNYLFMSMLVSFIAFTACGDDDEETPADPTITVTESYSIEGVVSGATGVKVELFKGATSAKNVTTDGAYSFSDLEKVAYTVKATAAGCIDQSVDVAFGEKTSQVLDFAMVVASTETKAVDEVVGQDKETTITNDESNQSSSAAETAVTVPASTTITNAESLPENATFSVTAYVPAAPTSDVAEGAKTEESAVLALNCQPSGAKFSQPVTLSADLKEKDIPASNMKLVNGSESVSVNLDGTVYSAPVTHFSTWTFQLEAPVNIGAATTEAANKTKYLKVGDNAVTYDEKCGYEVVSNPFSSSKIVSAFLTTRFGSKVKSVTKSFKANSEANGTLSYTVRQSYKPATITIGGKTVNVKVYSAASVETTGFKAEEHDGGSGQ